MRNRSPKWIEVEQLDNVCVLNHGKLNSTAIHLEGGRSAVYSPVSGASSAIKEFSSDEREIAFLIAPNHYHNKGLIEYVEAFPNAKLVCSDKARPRLEKQTGLNFQSQRSGTNVYSIGVYLECSTIIFGMLSNQIRIQCHK